jgi:hypothetical protein
MKEIKFRAWDKTTNTYFIPNQLYYDYKENSYVYKTICSGEHKLEQGVGLIDILGNFYFVGDIGEFDNGDRFVLKMEDYLEIYVDWIGDSECEDQARDLYRIERARIIGNINENPELLEG